MRVRNVACQLSPRDATRAAEFTHDARERKLHAVVEDLVAGIDVSDALYEHVQVRRLEDVAVKIHRHIPTL
jgi:hypothetical protein